jgi:hypothetical protein
MPRTLCPQHEVFVCRRPSIPAGRPVDAGRLEIEARFHLARPMWSCDGLKTLNKAWPEEARSMRRKGPA